MNKFIEITENGKRILINLGCVIKIEDHRKQCILHFNYCFHISSLLHPTSLKILVRHSLISGTFRM